MPVWVGIVIAGVGSVIMNFGLALQKQGAIKVPKLGKEKGAIAGFFKSKVWLLGFGLLLLGFGLNIYSAKIAPISLVQVSLGIGLAVLALFSVFYLKEKITRIEWVALVGMIIGIVLLGLSCIEETTAELPDGFKLAVITGGILLLSFLAYILGRRGRLGGFRTDSLLGIVSGLFIGLGAIYLRSMFLFVDNGKELLGYGICLPVLIITLCSGFGSDAEWVPARKGINRGRIRGGVQ